MFAYSRVCKKDDESVEIRPSRHDSQRDKTAFPPPTIGDRTRASRKSRSISRESSACFPSPRRTHAIYPRAFRQHRLLSAAATIIFESAAAGHARTTDLGANDRSRRDSDETADADKSREFLRSPRVRARARSERSLFRAVWKKPSLIGMVCETRLTINKDRYLIAHLAKRVTHAFEIRN